MPKVTTNPKCPAQIQKDSNERRGVKNKAFTLKLDDIELIKSLAERLNIPQNQLIMDAVRAYEKSI